MKEYTILKLEIGDYVKSLEDGRVSIVIDKREDLEHPYRSRIIRNVYGELLEVDDNEDMWHYFSEERWRIMSDLEKELL